jgi:hypothetical protein
MFSFYNFDTYQLIFCIKCVVNNLSIFLIDQLCFLVLQCLVTSYGSCVLVLVSDNKILPYL